MIEGGHDLVIHPSSPTADIWYDSGTEISIISSIVWNEIDRDSRIALTSATINGEVDSIMRSELKHTISILVDQRLTISFVSTPQFYLVIRTPYSQGLGEGWYDENSEAMIELQNTVVDHSNSTRHVFRGWTGSFEEEDAIFNILVTQALSINAEWDTEYLITARMTDSLGSELTPTDIIFRNLERSFEFDGLDDLWISPGRYSIEAIIWQGIDVSPADNNFEILSPRELRVALEVYPAIIHVIDSLGFPVSGAQLTVQLRNGTIVRSETGSEGVADIGLIPLGLFEGEVTYLGLTASFENPDPSTPFHEETILLGTYSAPIYLAILVAVIGMSIVLIRRR